MRRRSPRIPYTVILATLAVLLLLAVGFGLIPVGGGAAAGASSSADAEQIGTEGARFEYQTNHVSDDPALRLVQEGSRYSADELENIRVYEQRNEGVVNITTETVTYNWFLEPVPREGSSGSGSIIDARGYVLTNNHVVAEAFKVFVTLADGLRIEGEVIGKDAENDLAVIKFDPPENVELTTIPMGSSGDLRIGQKVLAIGNPFALDRTLTVGIVSGLGRPIRTSNRLVIRDMIQTDASINPGNSGGPLLDSSGTMIGINTVIYSPSGGSIGIGFAVPVDTARRVVPDLIQFGMVRRGWIDIVPRQLFPQLVRYADLPVSQGVLISEVIPGGNADAAGLRGGDPDNAVRYGNTIIYLGGDIIIEVDDHPVRSVANLYEALEDNVPGETVTVVYIRGNRERTSSLVLSERPERFQWD
jgi:S1-C subfamily serine protease